jgi:hypothetical protein
MLLGMRLTLHYRGPLPANGGPKDKHAIRQVFHQQLQTLWRQPPLSRHEDFLRPAPSNRDYSLLRPRGQFVFVPLVAAVMFAMAELEIVLLRPELPGQLITQGGDIDNRLKTLFDALAMPPDGQIPSGVAPGADESPFFCLLESDALVTSVSVRTEQLLEPVVGHKSLVEALIHVRTRVSDHTIGNDLMS